MVIDLFNKGVYSDETLSTDVSYSNMSIHDLMLIYERSRDSGNFNHELRTAIDSHEKNNPHDWHIMTASVQVEAAKNRIIDDYTEYNIYKTWEAMVEYNCIYPGTDSHTG